MKKYVTSACLALAFCFSYSVQAALVTTEMPNGLSTYSTSVGSLFDAKIMINSIADLGSIDFTLTYNSSKLTALSVDSGNIFGIAETFVLPGTPTWTGGVIHFAEAIDATSSLTTGMNITVPTLVATIHFQAIGTGVNNIINPTSLILSDFVGNSVGGSFQQANVTITAAPAVPIPPAIWLFGSALAGLSILSKRSQGSGASSKS